LHLIGGIGDFAFVAGSLLHPAHKWRISCCEVYAQADKKVFELSTARRAALRLPGCGTLS